MLSENVINRIFDALSAHIAVIDSTGRILETNRAWRDFAFQGGMPLQTDFSQMNYLDVCRTAGKKGDPDAQAVAEGIEQLIHGGTDLFLHDYPCHTQEERRWFYLRAVRIDEADPVKIIICHEDITQLKLAQESVTEANIALKVLLRQREQDQSDLERRLMSNIKTLVLPYIGKLHACDLNPDAENFLHTLESHIREILSPMVTSLNNADIVLTPQEMQVAVLVKDGKTTAEISDLLFLSESTVSFHRNNIRKKLGLKGRHENLRTRLMSMSP